MAKHSTSKPSQKTNNTTLLLLGLVMLVNALSFGTIIPLLYPYAQRFGVGPFELSALFASFSLAQLIATPIIGRLSDRYGRKLLLLGCLLGTSLSLALFASATVAWHLFVARILDGITGGNNSVAQAMIADSTTSSAERAKAFGILGAAYGFGFLLGPMLGGLMSQISLTAPFWFASGLALVGTILGWVLLPETLDRSLESKVEKEGMFHFGKVFTSLFDGTIGPVFVISLLVAVAFNIWILGFQTTTVDVLNMTPRDVGILFSLAGVVSIVMQAAGVRWLLNVVPRKRVLLLGSLALSVILMLLHLSGTSIVLFALISLAFMAISAPQNPVITAMITERTNPEDQGAALGLNQAYISLGQIVGPLLAGVIAGFWVPGIFVAAAAVLLVAAVAVMPLFGERHRKFDF
jgi:multidrug resistance protein